MPESSRSNKEYNNELDPISTFLSEWNDPEEEEEEFKSDFFIGLSGRRRKAALLLITVWSATIALHLISWGYWIILALTGVLLFQAIRLVSATPELIPEPLKDEELDKAPLVSLLVAAKNEEAVIGNLVKMLCNLDYPDNKYEVWIVDDYSTDRTPEILKQLGREYPQLRVLNRAAGAGGGKSGALNQVLSLTKGEIVAVFDADARVPQDLLRSVIPLFNSQEIGAVQVRKSIANASFNFWTKGQSTEMALDSYFQQQRIAIGGIGELRGNGQFVRRSALASCGGWNEETITDDLDLTLRLHLDGWKIGFLPSSGVEEEGVTSAGSLWHQRSRWAEGGYQRYLDYWRLILSNRLNWTKKIDLISFFLIIQYLLPSAAIPDLLIAVYFHHFPILAPLTVLMLSLSYWGMFNGCIRTRKLEKVKISDLVAIAGISLHCLLYMQHWLIIMPSTTARMSIRPKRLKWVKTIHEGAGEESFEF